MIGNKLVDFFLYCHLISIINDSEKKNTVKAFTCVQDRFRYYYINLV